MSGLSLDFLEPPQQTISPLPKFSPSSSVCGIGWPNVSGSRRVRSPEISARVAKITRGTVLPKESWKTKMQVDLKMKIYKDYQRSYYISLILCYKLSQKSNLKVKILTGQLVIMLFETNLFGQVRDFNHRSSHRKILLVTDTKFSVRHHHTMLYN